MASTTTGVRGHGYLLEVAGGVAVLMAANLLVAPNDPGFLSARPHPALVLTAVLAARYGLKEGLMSAFVTGGLIVGAHIVKASAFSIALFWRPEFYATPLALVATGFLFGALGELRRREAGAFSKRIASLEHELADQAVRFMAGVEAKHELERRVTDETASLSNLYSAARVMETLDADRLYPAIVRTTQQFLQADACQFFALDAGTLRLRAAEGPPPSRAELRIDEGLPGLAIRRGKPVSIRDLTLVSSLEELSRFDFVLAAPVTDGDGALLGCLTVTRLPVLRIAPVSLDRLNVVADWAGRALINAKKHSEVLASTVTDEVVQAYTYAYFQRRIREEQRRATRYGRPLAAVVFRVHALELVREERRMELSRLLASVFKRILRDTDLVCRYATDDSFAIILPETPAASAETVCARLSNEVRNFHFFPYVDEERELDFSVRALELHEAAAGTITR